MFHDQKPENTLDQDDWTEYKFVPRTKYPKVSATVRAGDLGPKSDFGVDPTGLPTFNDINTDWMLERIKPGATGQLWALGTYRPHLPFIAPQKFFDMIPEEVSLPPGLGANRFDPDNERSQRGVPREGIRLAQMQAKPGHALTRHGEYNQFVRSYLAAMAYADSKLGLVLDRLEECGLLEDTLIVLWSDHGWQLGEKLAFRKFTLWERALRVPMIMAGKGIPVQRLRQPVSLVDIAPTVLQLLDLPPSEEFSGQDLTRLIKGEGELIRPYAPALWGVRLRNDRPRFAFSVRTEKYRYTRYWDEGLELYDHDVDPYEHDNLLMSEDAAVLARAREISPSLDKYVDEFALTKDDLPELNLSVRGNDGDDDDD